MNTIKIIDAFNEEEKEQLLDCLLVWNRVKKKKAAKKIVLTEEEKSLVKSLKTVAAIKSIRNRVGCSLVEAKMAVDMLRETL